MIDIGRGGGVKYPNWRGCWLFMSPPASRASNSAMTAAAGVGSIGAGAGPGAPPLEAGTPDPKNRLRASAYGDGSPMARRIDFP